MSERVVDLFEMVDVEHHRDERDPEALQALELQLGNVQEVSAIPKTGE